MARWKCVPSAQLKAVNTDRLVVKSQHHMSAQLACLSRKHMLQLSLGSRARALSWRRPSRQPVLPPSLATDLFDRVSALIFSRYSLSD